MKTMFITDEESPCPKFIQNFIGDDPGTLEIDSELSLIFGKQESASNNKINTIVYDFCGVVIFGDIIMVLNRKPLH